VYKQLPELRMANFVVVAEGNCVYISPRTMTIGFMVKLYNPYRAKKEYFFIRPIFDLIFSYS